MNTVPRKKRIVVGMSGSSGAIYGIRTIEALVAADVDVHLVISAGARRTIPLETTWTVDRVHALAGTVYQEDDLAGAISSGSFLTDGMVVVPCSMKTVASIAHSLSMDLLSRAADVTLKEGRRLVLVPRETPLHVGHLQNLLRAAEIGAVILPPVPSFYHRPATIDDLINHTVGKILDQFQIPHTLFRRWAGAEG